MGTNNTQFRRKFCVWRRKVRDRNSDFSLRSTELRWSSHVGPRLTIGVLSEGYAWIPETPSFSKVLHGRFWESKASGSGSVRETPRVIAQASRGRKSSYSGLFSI